MILSQKHLDLMEHYSNNKVIKYVTLCLTLIGCLSQLYYHTKDFVDMDVVRELNKVSVEKFDLPDQTLCYSGKKTDEELYFKLIRENGTFKEYFIRKLDEHINFYEFHQILYQKTEVFDHIEIQFNSKIGQLANYEVHQHCVIKRLIKSFNICYTFSCSKRILNNEFNNRTFVSEYEPIYYNIRNFKKYTIKQRYLISYLGKNIVFKITLNKKLFLKNGLKDFYILLHEPNTFPKNLDSLTYVQELNGEGFRQLYTFTFLHIKRMEAPYSSNCTIRIKSKNRRLCEIEQSKQKFNSLLFGNYYPIKPEYQNLSLGLNQQYFYYKYNKKTLEKITNDCLVNTSLEQCDEYIYYIFGNLDRPKLALSEYLLKSLSIINFWFGFTIIQCMFNLHDDIAILYKRAVKKGYRKQIDQNNSNAIDYKIDNLIKNNSILKLKNSLDFINKIFRSKKESNELIQNAQLTDHLINQNRVLLYRNLQLNKWLYNPLTYLDSNTDNYFHNLNNNYLIFNRNSKKTKNDFNNDEIRQNIKIDYPNDNQINSDGNQINSDNNQINSDNQIINDNQISNNQNLDIRNYSTDHEFNNDDKLKNKSKDVYTHSSNNNNTNQSSRWEFIRKIFIKNRNQKINNSPIIRSNIIFE